MPNDWLLFRQTGPRVILAKAAPEETLTSVNRVQAPGPSAGRSDNGSACVLGFGWRLASPRCEQHGRQDVAGGILEVAHGFVELCLCDALGRHKRLA